MSNNAAVVDQYDNTKVVSAANGAGVEIVGTLTTHHYDDHCGGKQISQPFYLDCVTKGVRTSINNDLIVPVLRAVTHVLHSGFKVRQIASLPVLGGVEQVNAVVKDGKEFSIGYHLKIRYVRLYCPMCLAV